MRLVATEELPARAVKPKPLPTPEPAPPLPTTSPTSTRTLEIMARAVAGALATRAILLLTIVGAFVLTVMAMIHQSPWALAPLALYCCSAIPAVVYLEIRRRE